MDANLAMVPVPRWIELSRRRARSLFGRLTPHGAARVAGENSRTMENRIGRIEPLTTLRFFAAAFVVFYHTWPAVLGARPHLFGFGYISVSFFFTLSGYILAVVYLRRDRK